MNMHAYLIIKRYSLDLIEELINKYEITEDSDDEQETYN